MAFAYMETDMREKLIKDLTDAELKNVLDELFMDDTVDLIEEMPSNVVTRILKNVDKNDRKIINELLKSNSPKKWFRAYFNHGINQLYFWTKKDYSRAIWHLIHFLLIHMVM